MQEYAVKGNREIALDNESDRARLIKQGYDIVDKNGKLIAAGHGKTVPYAKYEALLSENEKLKAKLAAAAQKKK